MRGDVSIRPADDEDVGRYIEDRTDRHRFLDHLAGKRGVLLFAFGEDDELLGHVFLRRAAAEEAELRAGLPGVPLLQHLWVTESIDAAESARDWSGKPRHAFKPSVTGA